MVAGTNPRKRKIRLSTTTTTTTITCGAQMVMNDGVVPEQFRSIAQRFQQIRSRSIRRHRKSSAATDVVNQKMIDFFAQQDKSTSDASSDDSSQSQNDVEDARCCESRASSILSLADLHHDVTEPCPAADDVYEEEQHEDEEVEQQEDAEEEQQEEEEDVPDNDGVLHPLPQSLSSTTTTTTPAPSSTAVPLSTTTSAVDAANFDHEEDEDEDEEGEEEEDDEDEEEVEEEVAVENDDESEEEDTEDEDVQKEEVEDEEEADEKGDHDIEKMPDVSTLDKTIHDEISIRALSVTSPITAAAPTQSSASSADISPSFDTNDMSEATGNKSATASLVSSPNRRTSTVSNRRSVSIRSPAVDGRVDTPTAEEPEPEPSPAEPVEQMATEEAEQPATGPRYPSRNRMKPMEFWRNQRVKYGRDSTGLCFKVTGVEEGFPAYEARSSRSKRKKTHESGPGSARPAKRLVSLADMSIHASLAPEVLHKNKFAKKLARDKRLVASLKDINFTPSTASDGVELALTHKVGSLTQGMLKLHPFATKSRQQTVVPTTIFYVMFGAVTFSMDGKPPVVVKTGGSFRLDHKEWYSIENLRNDEAVLSFVISKVD